MGFSWGLGGVCQGFEKLGFSGVKMWGGGLKVDENRRRWSGVVLVGEESESCFDGGGWVG